jgi:hypothetical protein
MKLSDVITVLILIYSCNSKVDTQNKVKAKLQNYQAAMSQDTINIKDLRTLTLNQSIKKFGTPIQEDSFVLNESLSEFRIELYNIFTREEASSESIRIKESTWEKDSKHHITVWYKRKNNDWVPVHVLQWAKETEF